jgi:hypothetical protein
MASEAKHSAAQRQAPGCIPRLLFESAIMGRILWCAGRARGSSGTAASYLSATSMIQGEPGLADRQQSFCLIRTGA